MTKNEGEQRRGRTRDEETEEDTGRRKMGKGDEGEHGAGREKRERDVPSLSPPFRNLTYFTSSFPKIPRDSLDSHRGIPSPEEARVILSGRALRGGDDAKKEGIMI